MSSAAQTPPAASSMHAAANSRTGDRFVSSVFSDPAVGTAVGSGVGTSVGSDVGTSVGPADRNPVARVERLHFLFIEVRKTVAQAFVP